MPFDNLGDIFYNAAELTVNFHKQKLDSLKDALNFNTGYVFRLYNEGKLNCQDNIALKCPDKNVPFQFPSSLLIQMIDITHAKLGSPRRGFFERKLARSLEQHVFHFDGLVPLSYDETSGNYAALSDEALIESARRDCEELPRLDELEDI